MNKTSYFVFGVVLFVFMLSGAAVAQSKITFKGDPGDTPETAVVIIGAPNSSAGIAAEYDWLAKKFGQQNVDWRLRRQSVLQDQGKVYDRMELDLKDGSQKTVFFDISDFFGKF